MYFTKNWLSNNFKYIISRFNILFKQLLFNQDFTHLTIAIISIFKLAILVDIFRKVFSRLNILIQSLDLPWTIKFSSNSSEKIE